MKHLVQLVLDLKCQPAEQDLISSCTVVDQEGSAQLSLPSMDRGPTEVTMSAALNWQSTPSSALFCSHRQTKLGYQLCAAAVAEPALTLLAPDAKKHVDTELASKALKWKVQRADIATQDLLALQGDCVARFLVRLYREADIIRCQCIECTCHASPFATFAHVWVSDNNSMHTACYPATSFEPCRTPSPATARIAHPSMRRHWALYPQRQRCKARRCR